MKCKICENNLKQKECCSQEKNMWHKEAFVLILSDFTGVHNIKNHKEIGRITIYPPFIKYNLERPNKSMYLDGKSDSIEILITTSERLFPTKNNQFIELNNNRRIPFGVCIGNYGQGKLVHLIQNYNELD